jgi:two-component system sensor histidine kinase ChvG
MTMAAAHEASSVSGTSAEAAQASGSRIRLYDGRGRLAADSWRLTGPTYELRDPATQDWRKDAARALDRGFNALVGAEPI